MEKINPARLVPMDMFEETGWLRVDLAYAGPDSFCGPIYRREARLWLHEDLAAIALLAARILWEKHELRLVIYDGLRTVSAQEAMLETPVVRANPHWLMGEGSVLSTPGRGGHPRGMAVDVSLEDAGCCLIDMGTAFDEFPSGGSGPDTNRAHRDYAKLSDEIKKHRRILQDSMTGAAAALGMHLLPLPVEWWDFRFFHDVVNTWAPLDDRDLPLQMRMTARHLSHAGPPDFPDAHFEKMKERLLRQVRTATFTL